MQKKKGGGEGVQIACKIAYVLNGRNLNILCHKDCSGKRCYMVNLDITIFKMFTNIRECSWVLKDRHQWSAAISEKGRFLLI